MSSLAVTLFILILFLNLNLCKRIQQEQLKKVTFYTWFLFTIFGCSRKSFTEIECTQRVCVPDLTVFPQDITVSLI